jgi:hypothetical protein
MGFLRDSQSYSFTVGKAEQLEAHINYVGTLGWLPLDSWEKAVLSYVTEVSCLFPLLHLGLNPVSLSAHMTSIFYLL